MRKIVVGGIIFLLLIASLFLRRAFRPVRVISVPKRVVQQQVQQTLAPPSTADVELFEKTVVEAKQRLGQLNIPPHQQPLVSIISSPQPFINSHS